MSGAHFERDGCSLLAESVLNSGEIFNQRAETDKTAKMELKQILFFLDLLAQGGKLIGTKYAKQLEGPIWELTPEITASCFLHGQEEGLFCYTSSEKRLKKHLGEKLTKHNVK